MGGSNNSAFYSNESWSPAIRIRRIKVHPEVFAAYLDLYNDAYIMVDRMDEVLDHPEHRMIVREAEELGYTMPDIEGVRRHNALLRSFILASDPRNSAVLKDGLVEFPASSARQLHMIAFQSGMFIDDVCRNIKNTDYMLWFRVLRQMDVPYLGPTSLQEMFNVWASLTTSTAKQASHAPAVSRRLPGNWLKLVA